MITPWEVKSVDYEKIVEQFGASFLNTELLDEIGIDLVRRFYFAHRDCDKIIERNKFSIVTGRGPSGPIHIGHLIPFVVAKEFQRKYGCKIYIPVSDDEKYLVKKNLNWEDVEKFREENIKDILSLGFEKGKTFFFYSSEAPIYKEAIKISKKITFNTVKSVFGLNESANIGWIFYPAIQIVHILLPQMINKDEDVLVMVGVDQDPFIRLSRDLAEEFGYRKPACLLSKFIPSLAGGAKMSASEKESAIFLSDDKSIVEKKIMKYAFTGGRDTAAEQRKFGGKPEVCSVFNWLKLFLSDKELREREEKCKSGKILCGECKKDLIDRISNFLEKLRRNREKVDLDDYFLSLRQL